MDFLQLTGRKILVVGIANRKSVAYHVAKVLDQANAELIHVVRTEERRRSVSKFVNHGPIYVCDFEHEDQVRQLGDDMKEHGDLHGIVHSIAFADYESSMQPFHETTKSQFLRAVDVSCFSLINLAKVLKKQLTNDASVVTISISTTNMASENYGFMAPVKSALDSSIAFLAKSFSGFSDVRFNAVAPGLLKTSSSAGIPGYVDAYLFAEQVIPRRRAVQTEEVANAVAFLLSPRSSGINAQRIIIDAGMSINYFDNDIVSRVMDSAGSNRPD